MSEKQSVTVNGGGIGFAGLLAVLFIGLKLTHYVDWSWKWVLAPLWISWAVLAAVIMVVFLLVFLAELLK